MIVSQPFDPYLKWLGIAPKDQPPNHYRLLGINLFTDDPEVIQNSADREMAHVRTFQSGRYAELSQKLLNEIAAAKVCLLDPQKKEAYDRTLKAQSETAPKKLAKAKPLAATKPLTAKPAEPISLQPAASNDENLHNVPINVATPAGKLSRTRRRTKVPIVAAVAIGVLLVVAVVIYAISTSNNGGEVAGRNDVASNANPPADEGRTDTPADDPSPHDAAATGDPPSDDRDPTEPAPPKPPESASAEDLAVEPHDPVSPQPPDEAPDESTDDHAPPIYESTAETDTRRAVPVGPALEKATATVREVFQSEANAAATPEAKSALAKKIIEAGVQTPNDAAVQFTLFRVGRDLAIAAGDVQTAIEAIDKTAASFQIDAAAIKIDTLLKTSTQLRDAQQYKAFDAAAHPLIGAATAADNFELALKLADASLVAARRTGEIEVIKNAVTEKRAIESSAARYRAVERALAALETNPDDPGANLIVGKHRCFVNGDWPAGLALLANGNNEALKTLAAEDLEFAGDDADDRRQMALGDGWWDVAQQADEAESPAMLRRAAHWYERALDGLSAGLIKVKVKERLATIDRALAAAGDAGRGPAAGGHHGATTIVVWNTHHSIVLNRGTDEINVTVLSGNEIVWQRTNVKLPWASLNDPFVKFEVPALKFDKVRVDVTRWRHQGGGLSEIAVIQDGRNIARLAHATASAVWGESYDASRINDGVRNSNRHDEGIWLLPDNQPGWIELDLTEVDRSREAAPKGEDVLNIWNARNAISHDRGTDRCNVYYLSGDKVVWAEKDVQVPWSEDIDRHISLPLPRKTFDRVVVEITKYHGRGAGFNEIEIIRDGVNIARFGKATASARWDHRHSASRINDGITMSQTHGLGFWLLPDNQLGWIEIDLTDAGERESVNHPDQRFPVGQWVDVIPLMDLDRNIVRGTWYKKDGKLHSGLEGGAARVLAPVLPEGDYDLELVLERLVGNNDTTIYIPVSGHRVMLVLGHPCGLDKIDGKRWNENETTRSLELQIGRRYKVSISVRNEGPISSVTVAINDKPFLAWQGAASALMENDDWRMPPPLTLGVGSANTHHVFHSIRLKMLSGEAKLIE